MKIEKETWQKLWWNIYNFSGDFHQLQPIGKKEVLYSYSPLAMLWKNIINCSIFLNDNHRFKDDPVFGNILT